MDLAACIVSQVPLEGIVVRGGRRGVETYGLLHGVALTPYCLYRSVHVLRQTREPGLILSRYELFVGRIPHHAADTVESRVQVILTWVGALVLVVTPGEQDQLPKGVDVYVISNVRMGIKHIAHVATLRLGESTLAFIRERPGIGRCPDATRPEEIEIPVDVHPLRATRQTGIGVAVLTPPETLRLSAGRVGRLRVRLAIRVDVRAHEQLELLQNRFHLRRCEALMAIFQRCAGGIRFEQIGRKGYADIRSTPLAGMHTAGDQDPNPPCLATGMQPEHVGHPAFPSLLP